MQTDSIPIITYENAEVIGSDGSKGLGEALFGASSQAIGRFHVPTQEIADQLAHLLQGIGSILSQARQRAGDLADMELEEVSLTVEINGQGEVSLLGIGGAQAGTKGAIALKFTRKQSS